MRWHRDLGDGEDAAPEALQAAAVHRAGRHVTAPGADTRAANDDITG